MPDKEMGIPGEGSATLPKMTEADVAPRAYSVVEAHTRTYEDPIVASKGDVVVVGGADDDWPGWLWCTNKIGKSGWVPETLLNRVGDEAVVTEDYSALELTVHVGEVLRGSRTLDGWIWCQKNDGPAGWVPCKKLQALK